MAIGPVKLQAQSLVASDRQMLEHQAQILVGPWLTLTGLWLTLTGPWLTLTNPGSPLLILAGLGLCEV